MGDYRYDKGEKIVYGTTGICLVEDIVGKKYPDKTTRMCYVLKPLSNNSATFFIPVDSQVILEKSRYIYTKDEIEEIFTSAANKKMDWIDDKNVRATKFKEILSNGVGEDFLQMLACLYNRRIDVREMGKKISNSDEIILRSAEDMIVEEVMYIFGSDEGTAMEYIKKKLGISE